MSYINDALRKAQNERDGRYSKWSAALPPVVDEPRRLPNRRVMAAMAVALLLLVTAGLLAVLYVRDRPSSPDKGIRPPALAEERNAPSPGTGSGAVATPQRGAAEPGASAEQRYREALSAQRTGDHRRAEALYRQALAIEPGHVRALNNLGVLYMDAQKAEEAMAMFGKAIVLKRDYVDPYYNLACLYARKKEIDESLWYLKVAMTISDEVKNWVMKDADMENVVASPLFKKMMEGQKN